MKLISLIFLMIAIPACLCLADGEKETQNLLETTIDAGLKILQDDSLTDEEKLARFDTLLDKACHLDLMAMLALGRDNWLRFTPEQRPTFIKEYADLIKRSYYGKLAQQDSNKVSIHYLENEATGQTKRSLTAVMKNGETQLEVIYKFAFRDKKWAIYDVEIDGISLTVSYRSQFNDYLAKHSPEDLLAELSNGSASFKAAGEEKLSKTPNP